MKKTKIFYGNQHIDSMYCGKSKLAVLTWKMKHFTRKTIERMALVSALGWAMLAGPYIIPQAYAGDATIVEVVADLEAPVLERIAQCESPTGHYGKDGQVSRNANVNGSVDVGAYQINLKVWGAVATKLNLDLTNEADNKAFAEYLYLNYGTEPWYSSAKCWRK